jgi:hypothetical protein
MTTTLNRNDSAYVDRACPPWGCSLQYGRGWSDGWEDGDGDAPGEQGRGHGLTLGEHVGLYAREWVDRPNDESSTTESPTISLYGDGLERDEMTAEQARQHAVVVRQAADKLLEAADMLDRIEAAAA